MADVSRACARSSVRCRSCYPRRSKTQGFEACVGPPEGIAPAPPTDETVYLCTRTLDEFLAHPFPKPEPLLGKWLTARGLVMLAGFRGVGKTKYSMAVSAARSGLVMLA